ncbi:MAG TPA: hypothetical protein VGH42_11435, partial [Verrucomicrobiae bacterium]
HLSYYGNGTFFYHDDGGTGWWDTSYNWSSEDPSGIFTRIGDGYDLYDNNGASGTGCGDIFNPDPYSIPSVSFGGIDSYISHYFSKINYDFGGGHTYVRNSRSSMQIRTGGKSGLNQVNLFAINANATAYGQPSSIDWADAPDYWENTPGTTIEPNTIQIFGVTPDGDGNALMVLPEGININLPIWVPINTNNYAITVIPTEHVPGDCQVSIQAIDDAYEPGVVPNSSSDCDPSNPNNFTIYGQTGHFQISRTGDVLRPLWVRYGVSGDAVEGAEYGIGNYLPYLMGHLMTEQNLVYFEPGVSNLIVAVSPLFDPVNYGTKSVDISILPDSRFAAPPNSPPYYTLGQSNTTVHVNDSDVDAWFPVLTYPSGNPVPTNGVVEGYGEFHKEDYNPTSGCGSDVGIGPFLGAFYLATKATLGTDFSFQSDACSISPAGSAIFQNDADSYDSNKLEKINFYLIQTSFCVGWHEVLDNCHDVSYLTNSPFSFTVLSNNVASLGEKEVRLFTANPMQLLIMEFLVPPLSQLNNGNLGFFYIQN